MSISSRLSRAIIVASIALAALLVGFIWYATGDVGGSTTSTAAPASEPSRGPSVLTSVPSTQVDDQADASAGLTGQVVPTGQHASKHTGMSNARTAQDLLAEIGSDQRSRSGQDSHNATGLQAVNDKDCLVHALAARERYLAWLTSPRRRDWRSEISPESMPEHFAGAERLAVRPESRGQELCALDQIDQIPGGRDALEFYLAETSKSGQTDYLSGPDSFMVIAIACGLDRHTAAELVLRTASISLLENLSPTLARVAVARYLLRPSSKG